MKKTKTLLCFFLCLVLYQSPVAIGEKTADLTALLKVIDSMMVEDNAQYKLTMTVTRGKKNTEYQMTLWSKGRNFVGRTEKPIAQKGQVFLLNNHNCWIYYPSINKTVKTAQNQRLLGGDFSFTDLASINLLEDYHPEDSSFGGDEIRNLPFADQELVELAQEGEIIECLAKAGRQVTYPKVRVLINSSRDPVRLDFFTISGQLLGILLYKDYGELGGKVKPLTMVMRTSLNVDNYTTITYQAAQYDLEIPPIYFTEAYMRNLSIGR